MMLIGINIEIAYWGIISNDFFFYRNCEILDNYVFKVPTNQRQNAKLKVDQLKYDVKHLQVRHILSLI